jgi:hypothetical protein
MGRRHPQPYRLRKALRDFARLHPSTRRRPARPDWKVNMNITWEVVAAVMTLMTFVAGIWWRVEGMIRKNTDDLATHKLHVAESYITKAGMRDITDQIMEAIGGLGAQITGMNGRIDRMLERPTGQATPKTP